MNADSKFIAGPRRTPHTITTLFVFVFNFLQEISWNKSFRERKGGWGMTAYLQNAIRSKARDLAATVANRKKEDGRRVVGGGTRLIDSSALSKSGGA